MSTTYMENFYVRNEWPSKLTDTNISTILRRITYLTIT